jgi:hypothetical protein
VAGTTGLEPATSAVTGQHSNQLNYVPTLAKDAPDRTVSAWKNQLQNTRSDGGQCRARTYDLLLVRQAL